MSSGSYGGGWAMTIGALQETGPDATADALIISAATHTAMSTTTHAVRSERLPRSINDSPFSHAPNAHIRLRARTHPRD
jgi:hypothetical protein